MIEPTRRDDDERVGPRPVGPDPAKFWSEVNRRETVMATVLCTEGAECDLDFICKAHQLALDGPDEPEEEPFTHLYECDVYHTQWCECPPMNERPATDDIRSEAEQCDDYSRDACREDR